MRTKYRWNIYAGIATTKPAAVVINADEMPPAKLDEIVGKPTGQGFGAARKGPSVVGKPQDVVVDEDYQQGKSFKVED